jgi:DNA-binding PadR family transcriptional regulator
MRGETYEFPNWRFAAGDESRGRSGGGKGRGRRHFPNPDDIERLIALREMRGGGFRPGFGGGRGGRRGRARRGDVRTALLLLLAEEPRNGYQLMQAIEERSGGRWRPSPGSVYPSLSQLEDEGLIRSTQVDGGKAFEITDTGRAQLEERGDAPAPWDEGDEERSPAKLRDLIRGIAIAWTQIVQSGDDAQLDRATKVLTEARRELYRILAEETDGDTP